MKLLSEIELFLFDLDGTVYIGDTEIDGSFDAVNELRRRGKRVCFFTNNSSRMHTDYIARLNKLGLRVYSDEIYTSGQVTCEYILDHFRGARVFLLGNDRLRSEFEMYGIEVVDERPDLLVLGFDTSLTYDRLYKFCKYLAVGAQVDNPAAAPTKLPFIATHPDYCCPAPVAPMPDVGAMLEAIRLTVGRKPDYIMGKPYNIAGERIAKKYNLTPEKIAMVGDRLYTDIQFGINCGFTSVLVLSGETTAEDAEKSDIVADFTLSCVKDILYHFN